MTFVAKLCFFALFAVILSGVISPLVPSFKGFFPAAAGVVFFLCFLSFLSPILEMFSKLTKESQLGELFSLAWKGLGISFLVSVCASFCRDLGEEGIAGKLEMCGKGAILCLSLPVLEEILSLIEKIMP